MPSLTVTLIDVGWGDSILIESEDTSGDIHYALIDSNDTQTLRSSYIFVKRYLEKAGICIMDANPVFDFVLLSHAHADHAQGLKSLIQAFGTKNFWYPKSLQWTGFADLIRFANRSSNVHWHQAVDNTNILPNLGDVTMKILWPRQGKIDSGNENNNSIVLHLELNQVSFVLTGDAEKAVWNRIAFSIPSNTLFFKVPHHGSVNGTFDNGQPIWLNNFPKDICLGISSHVRPHDHPDQSVIDLFDSEGLQYFRTDKHYHVSFKTSGSNISVKFFH